MKESPVCLNSMEGQGADGILLKKNTRSSYGVALMMYPSTPDHDTYHLAR